MSRSQPNRNGNVHLPPRGLPTWGALHDVGSIRMLPNGQLTRGTNDEPTKNLIRDLCSANGVPVPATDIQWAIVLRAYRADGAEGALRSLRAPAAPSPATPAYIEHRQQIGRAITQVLQIPAEEPQAELPPATTQEQRIEELVLNPEDRVRDPRFSREASRQVWRPPPDYILRTPQSTRNYGNNSLFAALYGAPAMQSLLPNYESVNPLAPFANTPRQEPPPQEPQYMTQPTYPAQPTPGPPLFAVDSISEPDQQPPRDPNLWRPGEDYDVNDSSDMDDALTYMANEATAAGGSIAEQTREKYREGDLRLAADRSGYRGSGPARLRDVYVATDVREFVAAYRATFRWAETWVEFETLPRQLRLLVLMRIVNSLRPRREAVCQLPCMETEAMQALMLINETLHLAPVVERVDDVRSIELDDPSDDTPQAPGPEAT